MLRRYDRAWRPIGRPGDAWPSSDTQHVALSLRRLAAQLVAGQSVPPVSVMDCLARIDHRDVVVLEQSMHSSMRGGVLRDRGRWIIVVNAADERRRARYTLAHELGHVALATAGWDGHNRRCCPAPVREAFCDVFADDLLTPAPALRRTWPRVRRRARPVEALAACFDVAPSVAHRRLLQLGLTAPADDVLATRDPSSVSAPRDRPALLPASSDGPVARTSARSL